MSGDSGACAQIPFGILTTKSHGVTGFAAVCIREREDLAQDVFTVSVKARGCWIISERQQGGLGEVHRLGQQMGLTVLDP